MKMIVLACTGLVLLPLVVSSQERAVGGNLSQEASWSALKTLVDVARGKADVAQITANSALDKATKIETCGKLGKIYAPNVTGADSQGCKSAGGTPVQVLVTGYGSSYASARCPAGTILTGCTGARHPGLSDTCDERDCGLIGTRMVGTDTCQVGIDTDSGTQAAVTAICLRY